MYNKAKYLLDKIGAIVAIVVGSASLIMALISVFSMMGACEAIGKSGMGFVLFLGMALRIAINVVTIIFGIKTCGAPSKDTFKVKETGERRYTWMYNPKGFNITLIAISLTMGVLGFAVGDGVSLGGGVSVASVTAYLQIVFNVLYLVIGGLKLASICIIDNKVYNNDGEVVSRGSIPASSSSVHPVKAETSSIKTAEPSVEMKEKTAYIHCCYWNDWKGLIRETVQIDFENNKVTKIETIKTVTLMEYHCGFGIDLDIE